LNETAAERIGRPSPNSRGLDLDAL